MIRSLCDQLYTLMPATGKQRQVRIEAYDGYESPKLFGRTIGSLAAGRHLPAAARAGIAVRADLAGGWARGDQPRQQQLSRTGRSSEAGGSSGGGHQEIRRG